MQKRFIQIVLLVVFVLIAVGFAVYVITIQKGYLPVLTYTPSATSTPRTSPQYIFNHTPTPHPTPLPPPTPRGPFTLIATSTFSYNGKPIPPDCLWYATEGNLEDAQIAILDNCTKGPNTKYVIKNEGRDDKGWLYTDLGKDPDGGYPLGFEEYTVLLALNTNEYLIASQSNGGGTGYFDQLFWVKKSNNILTLTENLTGGDRCYGGLRHYSVKDRVVFFDKLLTPVTILDLGGADLYDYNVLSGPINCFGLAHFRYDPHDTEPKLTGVRFYDDEAEDQPEWTDQFIYQSCFNKVYNSYIKSGKTELTLDELKSFVKKFEQRCVQSPQ